MIFISCDYIYYLLFFLLFIPFRTFNLLKKKNYKFIKNLKSDLYNNKIEVI